MPVTNARLVDVLTRHQIYLEGVKVWQSGQFNSVMRELAAELRSLLSGVRYKTLDGLTKAELTALLVKLRSVQNRIYSRYTQELEKQLIAFMTAELAVTKAIFSRIGAESEIEESEDDSKRLPEIPKVPEVDAEMPDSEETSLFGIFVLSGTAAALVRLWSLIRNQPIPANGALPMDFVHSATASAKVAVENTIRKGFANRSEISAVIGELLGTPDVMHRNGVLNRVFNQHSAVADTLIQHVSSIVQASVSSHYFSQYIWNSVIDGVTTQICRERNGNIYRYGEGPLPPAHIRCRSSVAPLVGNDTPPESYYAWLKAQPEDVLRDILGDKKTADLLSGKLRAKDLPKFDDEKPISIDQFLRKLALILSR